MVFLTEEKPLSLKPFCDPSLFTMLALEQVSVITGLKRTQESTNKQKANNKVIKQGPGSSRDIHNNTSLSSAGTKAPTQVKDAMMMLTLLT